MYDVQTGQVRELLPQHEEEGVEEVEKFRDEIPPGHIQSCQANITREVRLYRSKGGPTSYKITTYNDTAYTTDILIITTAK